MEEDDVQIIDIIEKNDGLEAPPVCQAVETEEDELSWRMRRKTRVFDVREEPWESMGDEPPEVPEGEMYTDTSFPQEVAMKGYDRNEEWKRPCEFRKAPMLFTDGATRFDIKQGGFGTCYFLVTVSGLADKPRLIRQVIPDDPGCLYGPGYNGVFHCRFYFNGEWHDVYCDDYLPVRNGRPLGVSSSDRNEMWVCLLEKAYAKFHGSYKHVVGGNATKSFVALTGGMYESIKWRNCLPEGLYDRIQAALRCDGFLSCSVPKANHEEMGLIGGHAYSLTGAAKLTLRGNEIRLLRIRNPWGKAKGEWKGKWSDGSNVWRNVPDAVKERLNVRDRGDGEFWIEAEDFQEYFSSCHICNFSPDFDKDGDADKLNHVLCILGDWKGERVAGYRRKKKYLKFLVKVPDEDIDEDGLTPVAIQLLQTLENRKDKTHVSMRADLYESTPDGEIKQELTNFKVYRGYASHCYRYRLRPGNYVVLPHTYKAGTENGFIVRVFSRRLCDAGIHGEG